MAKKATTAYEKVWGTLFALVFLAAVGLAVWSQGRGDADWWLLGVIALAVGWIGLGFIKFGYDAATGVEKKARGE